MRALFFVIVFFTEILAIGQNWAPLELGVNSEVRCMLYDTNDNSLVLGGNFTQSGSMSAVSIAKWDGINWTQMGVGNPFAGYPVITLANFNHEIYAASFNSGVNGLKKWNGSNWDSVACGINGVVWTIEVIDDKMYVGGNFDNVDGHFCKGIAYWDGIGWSCVQMPAIIASSIAIEAIIKYNGELYIGGNFYSLAYPNDSIQNIIRYNGSTWKSVGGGLHGDVDNVECFAEYKNELYVAGTFTKAHGNAGNYIQKWDGTSWSDVGGGVMGIFEGNGQIHDLIVYNDELYAAGVFIEAGGIPAQYIAKWDGITWCGLGSEFDNVLTCLGIYENSLYVGGGFSTIDDSIVNHIAKWNGGNYIDTCGTLSASDQGSIRIKTTSLYPNPFHYEANLVLSEKIKGGTLTIYNSLGQEIQRTKNIQGKEILISRGGLNNGLYFFRLTVGSFLIGQGKLLVE